MHTYIIYTYLFHPIYTYIHTYIHNNIPNIHTVSTYIHTYIYIHTHQAEMRLEPVNDLVDDNHLEDRPDLNHRRLQHLQYTQVRSGQVSVSCTYVCMYVGTLITSCSHRIANSMRMKCRLERNSVQNN